MIHVFIYSEHVSNNPCDCYPPCQNVTYETKLNTVALQPDNNVFANADHVHHIQKRVALAVSLADGLNKITSERDKKLASSAMKAMDDVINTSKKVRAATHEVKRDISLLLSDLTPRVFFHSNVALASMLRVFNNGFATAWDNLEQFAIKPLLAGTQEMISLFNKTTESLRSPSVSDSLKSSLHLILQNTLSSHMELAVYVLENLTRVHETFLNAEPMVGYAAVTRAKKYDHLLIPSRTISQNPGRQKAIYDALTFSITNYIEDIVSLQHLAREYLQTGSSLSGSNTRDNVVSIRIRQYLASHLRDIQNHAAIFRNVIVMNAKKSLEERVNAFVSKNVSLSANGDAFVSELHVVDNAAVEVYTLLKNNFTQLIRDLQELADKGDKKVSVMELITAIDVRRSLLKLRMLTWSLERDYQTLLRRGRSFRNTLVLTWDAILNEELLRNFYFQIYKDVSSTSMDTEKLEELRQTLMSELQVESKSTDGDGLDSAFVDTSVADLRKRLNVDVATILFERQVREIDERIDDITSRLSATEQLRHNEEEMLVAMEMLVQNMESFNKRVTIDNEFMQYVNFAS